MCRAVMALASAVVCGVQMLVRVFLTIILMIENLIRMILQTLYNFISFMLQMISLIPICCVFCLTSKLKCLMCGGSGCPVHRRGGCDCVISLIIIIILFFIFRATGVLDKIFDKLGYSKAAPRSDARFGPTPGDFMDYLRNDTDYIDYAFKPVELAEKMKNVTASATRDLILDSLKSIAINAKVPRSVIKEKVAATVKTTTISPVLSTIANASTTSRNWTSFLYPML